MTEFLGGVFGARGKATRQGKDFLDAFVMGTNTGVRVEAQRDSDGKPIFTILRTPGQFGGSTEMAIATIDENGVIHYLDLLEGHSIREGSVGKEN